MKTGLDLTVEGDKAVVLISGGSDSASLLAHVKRNYDDVISVYVDFGEDFSLAERHAAKRLSTEHNVELLVFDNESIANQIQTMDGIVDIQTKEPGYYPLFEVNLLMIGGMIADMTDADDLYAGFYDGLGSSSDADVDISAGMEKAISNSSTHSFQVCLPFVGHSRGEVIAYGEEIGVTWEQTYSCLRDTDEPKNPVHCGECDSCKERLEKFQEAGVADSAEYADSMDL